MNNASTLLAGESFPREKEIAEIYSNLFSTNMDIFIGAFFSVTKYPELLLDKDFQRILVHEAQRLPLITEYALGQDIIELSESIIDAFETSEMNLVEFIGFVRVEMDSRSIYDIVTSLPKKIKGIKDEVYEQGMPDVSVIDEEA